MLPLLSSLKGLVKLSVFNIDNQVFRLHYKFTVIVLAMFSLVMTYSQFFGESIACTNDGSQNAPKDVVQLFCWTHNTYSIKEHFDKEVGGDHGVIYPGVGKIEKGQEIVQHKYYQWVCFVLALQALLFYFPRYMWKSLESETMKGLVLGLNVAAVDSEEVRKKHELLLRYLKTHCGRNQWYTIKYVFCECLNFINVLGQMFLLDTFLGGEFTRYGIKVLNFLNEDPRERVDPMIKIFPRMTMCKFFSAGPTGNNMPHDVYCILPLNIINEKIFVFLWFWFVILMTATAAALVYRAIVFLVPAVRIILLKIRCPMSCAGDVDKITSCSSLGDWFILYQLSKNIEAMHMAELLHKHAEALDTVKKAWTPLSSETGPYFTGIKEDRL